MGIGLVFIIILIELLIVSWIDLKKKKISNVWFIVNLAICAGFHLLMPSLYPLSWEIILFPLGFVLIGFFLFLFHVMGAGDSKFLASLFLIVPLEYHLSFFSKIVSATILIGLLLILVSLFKNGSKLKAYLIGQYWEGIKETIKSRFSYAPVILIAWFMFGIELWK